MNSETFGIPLRHNRGRGGFRGRGFMGPRGGRGRPLSRGSFGPPRGAPPGFREGFRGGRGGRDFSDFEYRVNLSALKAHIDTFLLYVGKNKKTFSTFVVVLFSRRITRWLHSTAALDPQRIVAPHHEIIPVEEMLWSQHLTERMKTSSQSPAPGLAALHEGVRVQLPFLRFEN